MLNAGCELKADREKPEEVWGRKESGGVQDRVHGGARQCRVRVQKERQLTWTRQQQRILSTRRETGAYLVLEDGEDPVPPLDIVLAVEVELQVPGREGRLGALDLEQAGSGSADGLLEVVGDLDGDGQDGRTRRL